MTQFRLGIIGGMGPKATLYFLTQLMQLINSEIKPLKDQDYPDMTILMESSTPDRTVEIMNDSKIASRLINNKIIKLHKEGCNPIVIPCITAHALINPDLLKSTVLDFRKCIINNFRSFRGKRMAILSTKGSIVTDVFKPFELYFDLIYPQKDDQDNIMSLIYGNQGLKSFNTNTRYCRDKLNNVINKLNANGTNLILAGCTEIEMFIASQDNINNFALPLKAICDNIISKLKDGF